MFLYFTCAYIVKTFIVVFRFLFDSNYIDRAKIYLWFTCDYADNSPFIPFQDVTTTRRIVLKYTNNELSAEILITCTTLVNWRADLIRIEDNDETSNIYNMFYLKVSFHVFNSKDKQNRNRHSRSRNVFPRRLNVQDELKTSVVIGNHCLGSCKSYYHAITGKTAPKWPECIVNLPNRNNV